jgi:hypothetical protein
MTDQQNGEASAPIVADLGRPETPEETAARKAESSRRHRASQTTRNLVLALVACLAVVLFLVLVVVRPDGEKLPPVDYLAVAEEAQSGASETLAAPLLPQGWTSNNAQLGTGSDDVEAWYVGFITPSGEFIALTQGIDANATWLSTTISSEGRPLEVTGSEDLEGTEWAVYDNREAEKPGNFAYAMSTEAGANTYVLNGTADANEFRTLATALAAQFITGG